MKGIMNIAFAIQQYVIYKFWICICGKKYMKKSKMELVRLPNENTINVQVIHL